MVRLTITLSDNRYRALKGLLHEPGPPAKAPPDVHDRHLWALLEDAPTAVLVTGDQALRRSAPEPTRILSPRQFVARLSDVLRDGGPRR
jgi:predicted nucleic acid-binding protein